MLGASRFAFGDQWIDYLSAPHTHQDNALKAGEVVLDRYVGKAIGGIGGVVLHAKSSTSGNNAAAALGSIIHKAWIPPLGYIKNYVIPGTKKRVDAFNRRTKHILELKPNNKRQINRGKKQVEGYIEDLQKVFPDETITGDVVTY